MYTKLAFVISLTFANHISGFLQTSDLPCNFLDSVNITDGVRLKNNRILYNGVEYPQNQYAKVNYTLKNGNISEPSEPYIRGCLCNIKRCIRLCCPYGQFVDTSIKVGKKCRVDEAAKNFESEIEETDGKISKIMFDDHFGYVDDRPCPQFFSIEHNYTLLHVSCLELR